MLDLLETKKQSCRVTNNIPLSPYGTEELLVLHIIIIQRFKDTLLHGKTLSPAATKAHTDRPIANHLKIWDKLRNCTIRGSTVILFTLREQGLIFILREPHEPPQNLVSLFKLYILCTKYLVKYSSLCAELKLKRFALKRQIRNPKSNFCCW